MCRDERDDQPRRSGIYLSAGQACAVRPSGCLLTSRLRVWLVAMCVAHFVIGCTTLNSAPDRKPAAHPSSTTLFSVKFSYGQRADRPMTGLVVSVDDDDGVGSKQFAFGPNTRIPGYYTDFLVRMDLQPGRYRVRRLSAVMGGAIAAEFDVTVDMLFEVRADTTSYLGRIELGGSQATRDPNAGGMQRIEMTDGYAEDLPNLVRAWPSLRTRSIARTSPAFAAAPSITPNVPPPQELSSGPAPSIKPSVPQAQELSVGPAPSIKPNVSAPQELLVSPAPSNKPNVLQPAEPLVMREAPVSRIKPPAAAPASAEPAAPAPEQAPIRARASPARLDEAAALAARLPPGALPAFRSFLKSALPRAFALSDSGHYGMAGGGQEVVRRALIDCVRASAPNKQTCRVFAVDEALVAAPREQAGPSVAAPTSVPNAN